MVVCRYNQGRVRNNGIRLMASAGGLGYHKQKVRQLLVILALLLLLLLMAAISLQTGTYQVEFNQLLATLLGNNQDQLTNHLLFNLRLPRTVAALLAGAGLALAGSIMQTLLKNPLASPSTLGISQGAAFGAAFAIILLGSGQITVGNADAMLLKSRSIMAGSAFIGAFIGIGVIMLISYLRQLASEAMVLAGVAMAAFFSAGTMLLQYFATDQQVAATLFWTFGDLGKAGWFENSLMALLLIPAMLFVILNGWNLNSLQWGEDVARTLGVNTKTLLLVGLGLACMLTAIITAFLGIIAFVGLMAPHLIRPFIGTDQRFLQPAAALTGAVLLLLADLLSRTILSPVIIPVGIITSFAGAPLFLFLLLRRRGP